MIEVKQLAVQAGGFHVRDINFEIPDSQYGVLMGKTGSGKTTVLEAICGLRKVTSGTILLNGEDVTGRKASERGIGYVPQDRALFQTMTVRDHLAFALEVRRWDKPNIKSRVQEMAELLSIEHLLPRKPQGLSGGESQRVALGRALAFHPAILCLDEPLSALDDDTREEMCRLLKSVQAATGVTILHVTHHRGEADLLANQILLLQHGKVVQRSNNATFP
jgi:ABC-type sugar transport system ATPase subunit